MGNNHLPYKLNTFEYYLAKKPLRIVLTTTSNTFLAENEKN